MTLDPDAARECVAAEHGDVLAAVGACADAVTDSWETSTIGDGGSLADGLESCLAESGVLQALPGVLAAAVRAAGATLPSEPVAAPPYVAVTSRGPVLRGTLDDGRLVVTLAVFRVTDDRQYERTDVDVDVQVSLMGAGRA